MNCTALEEIVLPEELTYISYSTFEGCTALKSVAISEKSTTISTSAFKNCSSLSSINFPKTLRTIGENAFQGCEGLTEVVLYPGLQTLGTNAFDGCTGIVKAVYPDNLENQFGDATAIAYPAESLITEDGIIYNPNDGVLYYAPSDIQGEVLIPRGVTKIGPAAFKGCSLLTEIVIPSEVTEIGEEAFAESGIKRLIIGYGMKKIGDRAFAGDKITYFYITALTPPELGEDVFDSMTAKVNVVYSNDYTADPVWSQFNIISYYSNHELASDSKNCFLTPGESKQLSVRFVYPSNADLKYIYWKSSDPEVADVDRNGVVTMNPSAPAGQTCTITAYTLFEKSGVWNFRINEHDMAGVDMFRYGEGLNQSPLTVKDNNGDGTEWVFGWPRTMFLLLGAEGRTFDDSMITKESFRLQKGKGYKLVVKASSEISAYYKEHETILEVSKYREGESDNPEVLISEIPGYSDYRYPREFPEYVSYFNVEEDGDYYFQFRGYGGEGGLQVWSMVLSEFDTDYYPGPVEGLRAYLETETPLTATVEFMLPSKSIYGSELPEDVISKVEIYRENELVATLTDNLIPGEKIKWIDTAPVEGMNKYSVTVHNLNLVSEKSEVSSLISPMTPTVVTDLSVKKIAGGKNRISWTAPVKSVEGLDIDPTVVRYVVKRKVNGQEPETLTTLDAVTEYEDPFNPEEITKVVYTVEAMIKEHVSAAVSTEELVLSLYHLPFTESFSYTSSGKLPEDWPQIRYDGYKGNPVDWMTEYVVSIGNSYFHAYDSDRAFVAFGTARQKEGDWTLLYSPEISVSETNAISFDFYFLHSSVTPESDDMLEIYVSKDRETPVKIKDIHRLAEESGWKRYNIYLPDLENVETLQFEFKGISGGKKLGFAMDAIRIYSPKEYDLEMKTFEVETSVMSGFDTKGKIGVNNIGAHDVPANAYEIKLYANGELIETFSGDDLAAGNEYDIEFSIPVNISHLDDGIDVEAEIVYPADSDNDNNTSSVIHINAGAYWTAPAKVRELDGYVEGNSLHLNWKHLEATQFENAEAQLTLDNEEAKISRESFEADNSVISPDYFIDSDGNRWRNVDFEQGDVIEKYGIPAGQRAFTYVSKELFEEFPFSSFDGDDTHGMLYCKAPNIYESDYLISPLLPGVGAHEIEFRARSVEYGAHFRIEYTDREDFSDDEIEDIFLPRDEEFPQPTYLGSYDGWKHFRLSIPGDAKYVAIHVISNANRPNIENFDGDEICFDNIKLTSKPIEQPTYNLYYRESESSDTQYYSSNRAMAPKAVSGKLMKHNEEPIPTGEYVLDLPTKATDFQVSTAYSKGESELSHPYHFDLQTGLTSVSADSQVRIRVEGRRISAVRNGENVKFTIYSLDGAVVAKDVDSFVAAVSGAYIVKTETTSATVMVK